MAVKDRSDQPRRTIISALREGFMTGIDRGLAPGLSEGLRRYMPCCVAVVLIGGPALMLLATVRFVIGVPLCTTVVGSFAGTAAVAVSCTRAVLKTIRSTQKPEPRRADRLGTTNEDTVDLAEVKSDVVV